MRLSDLLNGVAMITVILVVSVGESAKADTIHVPGDYQTIQLAIDAAVDGDAIIVAAGLYTEAINLRGKSIQLESDSGPEVTTIDATGLDTSVVTLASGESRDTVVAGFTITGGSGNKYRSGSRRGAGLYIVDSSPTIRDCVVIGNRLDSTGAGCFVEDASHPLIESTRFEANEAGNSAGGMYVGDPAQVTLISCVFVGNIADGGAALHLNHAAESVITGCEFRANTALGNGGCVTMSGPPSGVLIENCLFTMNVGGNGAALRLGGGVEAEIRHCVFEENWAFEMGAALFVDRAQVLVANTIFARNSANQAGAIRVMDYGSRVSNLTVVNCTFAENFATVGAALVTEDFAAVSVVNSAVWGNAGARPIEGRADVRYSLVEGWYPGEGNINADPLFVNPGDGDYRIASGSPCIDAADNLAVPPWLIVDSAGWPRFRDDRGTPDTGVGVSPVVDVGAFEFQGTTLRATPAR